MRILDSPVGRLVSTLSMSAPAAKAKVPFFNAPSPGRIEVYADEGGPIYVGGREAVLERFNENDYDACLGAAIVGPDW